MLGQYQTYKGQHPTYGQGNPQWVQNQVPYRQNPPLWGKNTYQQGWNPQFGSPQRPCMSFSMKLPLLATLELYDVSRLTNDPIFHLPYYPLVPTKIPSNCPKFEGKYKEDPKSM